MSDEPEAFPGSNDKIKRRGRPPGKKRHDIADAPIDGDYRLDMIVNKQRGWDYVLMSDKDRARRQHLGWQPEHWGEGCARQLYDYGSHKDGEEIRVGNQLTLMKMPTARRAAIVANERKWHTDAKANLKKAAETSGGYQKQKLGVQF